MKALIILFFVNITLLTHAQSDPIIEQKAAEFSEALVNEEFETVLKNLAPPAGVEIDAEMLRTVWSQIQEKFGAYQYKEAVINTLIEGKKIVSYQFFTFKNTLLDLKLSFNENKLIEAFYFLPHKVLELDLISNDQFTEEEIFVKTGKKIKLRGILTLPTASEKVPVIILVHGSGPQDMDETIGPNKIFQDLAHQLAEKGIAVIRYTKRTREYGGRPEMDLLNLTLFEETIEDAISAVDLAKKDKRIDKNNIFVLGHSLGGMSAPRIAQMSKNIKGIIIMSGNSRPLEVLLQEQFNYLFNEDNEITAEEEILLADFKTQLEALEKFRIEGKTNATLPMGLSSKYWEYLNEYDQIATAQDIAQPILILQGQRDYQVTTSDFELWNKSLSKKQNVTYKLYEKLNHLMHEGMGKSFPSEYQIKNELPSYLISDISAWIFAQK